MLVLQTSKSCGRSPSSASVGVSIVSLYKRRWSSFEGTFKVSLLSSQAPFLLVEATERCQTIDQLSRHVSHNKHTLLQELLTAGAFLFRGFSDVTPSTFNTFFQSLSLPPVSYIGGGSPGRDRITGDVFSSTKMAPYSRLWIHNEMSYALNSPNRVFFCSIKEPSEGGSTPIADFRTILKKLDSTLINSLKKRQIVYKRFYIDEKNYEKYNQKGSHLIKSWQDAFMTTDPIVMESNAKAAGFSVEWTDDGGVVALSPALPPTRHHPITKEEVWFNQIPGWDPRMGVTTYFASPTDYNDFSKGEELVKTKTYEELFQIYPQGVLYADTLTPIDFEVLKKVHSVTWNERVEFQWKHGDILMMDNYYTGHGRTQYKGDRLVVAALSS